MINQFSSLRERFDAQYEPVTESGCWIWTGSLSSRGYGTIKHKYKTKSAHRVSYELHHGEIQEGKVVCHKCDNPSCVNPSHLYAGTLSDNARDKVKRNRCNPTRGTKNPRAKLNNEQVLTIFRSKENGSILADAYGVSRTTVSEIKSGRKWGWLTAANNRRGNI